MFVRSPALQLIHQPSLQGLRRGIKRTWLTAAVVTSCALTTVWAQPLAHSPQVGAAAGSTSVSGAPADGRQSLPWRGAEQQQAAYLDTLKTLVGIESGSRDLDGLRALAKVVADRLSAMGMEVKTIPTRAPEFHPMLKGAELGPMVYGRKAGKGSKKVLLIAHMDTVYPRGMGEKQPFRIEGDRAYGLGIADDKAGVALILHTVDLLARLGYDDYAELGVLINGDEEVGSPGSGPMLTELGGQYDAVLSFEGGGGRTDMVRLATSSIAIAELKVTGRASHAGGNPEGGRNAIYELAYQIMKTRHFGDADKGLKINWTVIEGGGVRNVIPASASAIADIRSLTNADLDIMEQALRKAIQDKLIPDTKIELTFFRSRPAFVPNEASVALARHAQMLFKGIGLPLEIRDKASGGGTDAAFAGLRPKGGVLESFGLRGFGAHSNDNEYVMIDSIV
ncbi:MAG: glutamate carboxypeptidase, partial [Betaproteobacteria bacterium]